MLKQRLLFGAILIAVLVGLVFLDDRLAGATHLGLRVIRHDGAIVALVLAVLAALGTREMCILAEAAGHAPLRVWTAFSNYLFILIPYFAHNGLLGSGGAPVNESDRYILAWLTVTFLGACLLVAARRRSAGAIADIAITMLMVFYLGLLPTFLVRIRSDGSAWLLLYVVAVVKACDIGAYLTGWAAGRRKLIEWLSPKKTIEGLIGGIVLSIATSLILSQQIGIRIGPPGSGQSLAISTQAAVWFGLLMALLGQAGDLLESLFKRGARIKDSGGWVPEFGGVLDIVDSLLPSAPVAYWFLLQYVGS